MLATPLMFKANYYLGLEQVSLAEIGGYIVSLVVLGNKKEVRRNLVAPVPGFLLALFVFLLLNLALFLKDTDLVQAWHYFLHQQIAYGQGDFFYPLKAIFIFLLGLITFFTTSDVELDRRRRFLIGWGTLAVLLIVNLYGFVHVYKYGLGVAARFKIASTFADCNSLAAYLILMLPFPLYCLQHRAFWSKFVGACLLGLTFLLMFLSGSRTSTYLALIAAAAIGCYNLYLYRKGLWRKTIFWAGLALVLLGIGLITWATTTNYSVYQNKYNWPQVVHRSMVLLNLRAPWYEKIGSRGEYWQAAWLMFKEKPLTGYGLGRYFNKVSEYQAEAAYNGRKFVDKAHDNAHNYFLQLLAETGLIGLALFLAPLVLIFKKKGLAMFAWEKGDFLAWGLLLYLAAMLLGHQLVIIEHQLLFWFYLALTWRNFSFKRDYNLPN
jgi:O-antigen ligase